LKKWKKVLEALRTSRRGRDHKQRCRHCDFRSDQNDST
jgi:hypothetical protein